MWLASGTGDEPMSAAGLSEARLGRMHDVMAGSVGKFGWDGGLGTSWYSDPREGTVTIPMTQRAWTSPSPPDVCLDFWTSAHQSNDD
jgi:CubicO group peptidase (beta-lactamase class C family)